MATGIYKRTKQQIDRLKEMTFKNRFEKGHKGYWSGKKMSEEHRKKMSENSVGMTGKNHTKKSRKKMRQSAIIRMPYTKQKDTSIEFKIEAELQKRNINYQKQVPLCKIARVDFYLPEYRIVIQCDGDYWHNLPKVKKRGERQDKVLTFNGFNIYRFWEHEINKSTEECINQINFYGKR